jgi:hypothetical protein
MVVYTICPALVFSCHKSEVSYTLFCSVSAPYSQWGCLLCCQRSKFIWPREQCEAVYLSAWAGLFFFYYFGNMTTIIYLTGSFPSYCELTIGILIPELVWHTDGLVHVRLKCYLCGLPLWFYEILSFGMFAVSLKRTALATYAWFTGEKLSHIWPLLSCFDLFRKLHFWASLNMRI